MCGFADSVLYRQRIGAEGDNYAIGVAARAAKNVGWRMAESELVASLKRQGTSTSAVALTLPRSLPGHG